MPTTLQWTEYLIEDVPELRDALLENERDNSGFEDHLFFGEIADWASHEYVADNCSPKLDRLLANLERGFSDGDAYRRNLIATSFIENLTWRSPLLATLGPEMTKAARGIYPASFE